MAVPLVSAIIPTHNRAAMLSKAIRSVLQQSHANLEVIVVDDASNDTTTEVVKQINEPRVRYIRHERNRGGSASRNTGIQAAQGEYIAFLDDDDEWVADKIKEQITIIEGFDAVTCTSLPEHVEHKHLPLVTTIELNDLLEGKYTYGGTGILLAKTDILKEIQFDESLPRYQDWDLFIRLAQKHRIAFLNKPLLISSDGMHPRITNSVTRLPFAELERQYVMLEKHKALFGNKLFKRHMSEALLYGIRQRQNKLSMIVQIASRYGTLNVLRVLARRLWYTVINT